MRIEAGETMHACWAAASERGATHELDEDAFGVCGDAELFVVADGEGRDAARFAVDTLIAFGARAELAGASPLRSPPIDPLAAAIHAAHEQLRHRGGACTLAAVRLTPPWASIAHVGDCRAGRLRGDRLEWLTIDPSVLADRAGATAEALTEITEGHVNAVANALGVGESIALEVRYVPVARGDVLVLATGSLRTGDRIRVQLSDRTRALVDRCRAAVERSDRDDRTLVAIALS